MIGRKKLKRTQIESSIEA